MRVVQVVPSLDVGGAERMAALLALELRRAGVEASLVSLFAPTGSWIEAELRREGVPLTFLGKRPGLDLRMVGSLARALRALGPDVVHTHLHVLKYVLPAWALVPRARVVHTLHNLAEHELEAHSRGVHRLAFRLGVVPVAIGDAVARSVQAVYGRPAGAVIPNGIPVAAVRPPEGARAAVVAELGLPPAAPILLAVGRLNPQKNHALLLEAFADPRLAAAHLLLAGEGALREELARRASEHGVADRVHFLGVRADVPRLYGAADALVLPSSWEGNPLVVMEAMAAGVAVVATAVGCVPELVTAETGWLVPPGEARALADALAAVVADRDAAARRGLAGLARATARFDAPVMARAYLALYQGRSAPPAGGAPQPDLR